MGALGRAGKPRLEVAIRTPTLTCASVHPFLSWEKGALSPRPHAPRPQVRALRPLHVKPAAPVPGRLPFGAWGVKPHLGPPSPLPCSAPGAAAARLVHSPPLPLLQMERGAQGTRTPSASGPQAGGAGLRFPRTAARARPEVEVVGGGGCAALDAVDITAESARLSRGSRAPLHLLPRFHSAPSRRLGRTAAGGGKEGRRNGGKVPPLPAVKVNMKESGRACPRLWIRARAPPDSPIPAVGAPQPAGARWTLEIRGTECVSPAGRPPSRVHLAPLRGGAFCCGGCGGVVCFSGSTGLARP